MLNMFLRGAAVLASINTQQSTTLRAENPTAFQTLQGLSPSPPRPHQLFAMTQDTPKVMSLDASFKVLPSVTYFVLGHRVCANPLSVLRLAAQQPAAKNTSRPLSSSPNLRPPSRHIAMDNSGQGVIPTLGRLETHPTSDLHEGPWCKLVVHFPS
jgi:hypothetical protein